MAMFKNRLIAMVSLAAVTGTVAVSGLTAASASTSGQPSASGIERFQLMTTSETSNKESIIAIGGVFTAGGTDYQGNKVDRVVFPHGTFKIRHSAGQGTQNFNPRTCLGVISQHGTYTIGHGTGRYAGISGHGRYQLSIVFVAARSKGKCTQKTAAYQQLIRARGPVTLRH
jgi:hypothetical protein